MGFSDGREKEWEKQAFVRNVIELLEINEYPVRKQPVQATCLKGGSHAISW